MVRLIATDLDGTFLSGPRSVDPVNVAAVREAAARGVTTLFCTGRPARWLGFLHDVGAHTHAITSNGAQIIDLTTGVVEHEWPIPDDALRAAVATIRTALPDATFGLEWGDEFGSEIELDQRDWDDYLVGPVDELLQRRGDTLKLLVRHDSLPSDRLAARVTELVSDSLCCTYSWMSEHGLAELSAPGISKAHALAVWAASRGFSADETVAFGDMPNDLQMLRWAARGYVMPTAHPSLRSGEFSVVAGEQSTAVGRTIHELIRHLTSQ